MVNITLSIPDDMYKFMKKYPELRWSEVARKSISEKLKDLQLLEDLKDCEEGERAIERGDVISHKDLIKEMGLENDI